MTILMHTQLVKYVATAGVVRCSGALGMPPDRVHRQMERANKQGRDGDRPSVGRPFRENRL